MAKQAPITITTKPISSISRPIDLIESIAKNVSEDPNPAPLYEVAIRDTIERFEATGLPFVCGRRTEEVSQLLHVSRAWPSKHRVTAPVDPISRRRKKCAAVRSNPAKIGAGARERLIFN